MTPPLAVSLDVSQAVAAHLGVAPDKMVLVHDEDSALLFHFWGDLYGALLGAMLQAELDWRRTASSARRSTNIVCACRWPGPPACLG